MTEKHTMRELVRLQELLYEALETEHGGVRLYETALRCAVNPQLKEEWQEYLGQTRHHEQVLLELFAKLDLDPVADTPGRAVVRHLGESLLKAMEMALASGDAEAAQCVAAECIVMAETKDHLNWQLLGHAVARLDGEEKVALRTAQEEVEDEEDEHLYHTAGWARELRLQALGLPALLPPPEEEQGVTSMMGAARAMQTRRVKLKAD
jgi:hypothetical protein